MVDREKVIKKAERIICSTVDRNMIDSFCEDVIDLLKEQEPVAPRKVKRYIQYSDTAVNFINTYDCGNCGAELPDNSKYCPACGRAVKWDD